jgi:hypothetical protein
MNYPTRSVVPADSGAAAMTNGNPDCPKCGRTMIILNHRKAILKDITDDGEFVDVEFPYLRYGCRKCEFSRSEPIPERYKMRKMTKRVAEWIRDFPGFAVDAAAEADLHPNTVWAVRQEMGRGYKDRKKYSQSRGDHGKKAKEDSRA